MKAGLPETIQRICVVGSTGSGKTTLAEELALRLHIPHIELDALHWKPNWEHNETSEFRALVDTATCGPAWVVDGNYGVVRDLVWSRTQAIVWLDYPLLVSMWRLWIRTWRRVISKEILWGTNKERLWAQFFSRDSLFLWAMTTYRRRKRTYALLTAAPEYADLKIYHFSSPTQTKSWLQTLPVKSVSSTSGE